MGLCQRNEPFGGEALFFAVFLCGLHNLRWVDIAKAWYAVIPTDKGDLCYNILADGGGVDTASQRQDHGRRK